MKVEDAHLSQDANDVERRLRQAITSRRRDQFNGVLDEAHERYARPRQRIEGAERRAATFQGAAAIAASLVVGVSGLFLGEKKVPHNGWGIALAAVVLLTLGCLFFAALNAVRALATTRQMMNASSEDIIRRAEIDAGVALAEHCAFLLVAGDHNESYAAFKIQCMKHAGRWLVWALGLFLVLMLVVFSFVVFG